MDGLLFYIIIFGIFAYILVQSGAWTVKFLKRLSAFLEISEFTVAFILMAFATSLPEIFVSIEAARQGDSVLAFGNVIGSNIIYPTLLIGIVTLLGRGLKMEEKLFAKTNIYASLISLAPFAMMLDLELSRVEGFLLFVLFVWYFGSVIKKRAFFKKIYHDVSGENYISLKYFLKNLAYFIISISLLLLSSDAVVNSSIQIAKIINFPLILIGIFVVAFGVALPELVFSVKSMIANNGSMIIGNMFGSLVVNAGLALSIAAMISPIKIVNPAFFYVSAFFAIGSLVLFGVLVRTKKVISWREGIILLLFYILFIGVGLLLSEPSSLQKEESAHVVYQERFGELQKIQHGL